MRASFLRSLFLLPPLLLSACGLNSSSQLSSSSEAKLDRCSDLIGSCDYYRCVEEERATCGESGYPLGYGQRYCEILSAIDFPASVTNLAKAVHPADGNVWKGEVRSCLQVEMEKYFSANPNRSCDDLRSFAFASHPHCYTQEVSFCNLNVASIVAVGLSIAPKDLLAAESQQQVRDTAKICVEQFSKRLETERGFALRFELLKYRTIWKAVAASPANLTSWLDRFLKTGEETVED